MAEGTYILIKENAESTYDEKFVQAENGKVLGFDVGLNPVMVDPGEGDFATKALDNLASVAINTSLISDTDSTDDLGSSAKYWANLYVDTIYTPQINGGAAANDDITIQGTTNATRTTSYVFLQPNGGFTKIGSTTPPIAVLDIYGSIFIEPPVGDSYVSFGNSGGIGELRLTYRLEGGKHRIGFTDGASPSNWIFYAQYSGNNFYIIRSGGLEINNVDVASNHYSSNAYSTDGWKYVGTGLATRYEQAYGYHKFLTAVSGTAGNAITWIERLMITAAGNMYFGAVSPFGSFGIGTSSPSGLIHTYNNANSMSTIHGRFENINEGGRTQFIVTSGTYPNNFFSLMTHGTSVTNNYYASTGGYNDAGKAILLGQGNSMREFVIGTYNAKPLGLFTNNTTRITILSGGAVGIGTTSPTAVLHLKAGTATASTAPLKFTSGTLLGTPEAGAFEFLTDNIHITISTGAARKGIILDDGTRLTSGKIPIATTNGRLIDGQTPLAGTKVYYVADSSEGAATRKLTFVDGILTSET